LVPSGCCPQGEGKHGTVTNRSHAIRAVHARALDADGVGWAILPVRSGEFLNKAVLNRSLTGFLRFAEQPRKAEGAVDKIREDEQDEPLELSYVEVLFSTGDTSPCMAVDWHFSNVMK
jgi:hypothetical protein